MIIYVLKDLKAAISRGHLDLDALPISMIRVQVKHAFFVGISPSLFLAETVISASLKSWTNEKVAFG